MKIYVYLKTVLHTHLSSEKDYKHPSYSPKQQGHGHEHFPDLCSCAHLRVWEILLQASSSSTLTWTVILIIERDVTPAATQGQGSYVLLIHAVDCIVKGVLVESQSIYHHRTSQGQGENPRSPHGNSAFIKI